MRLPWSRQADPPPADDDDAQNYDDEPEGDDEPEDPLADLDDDARGVAEAYAERIRKEEQAKFLQARSAMQQAGLDVVDGKLVGDPKQLAQWMQPQAAQQPVAPQAPVAEEDEAWPDPTYDREAFEKRLAGYVAKQQAVAQQESSGYTQTMQDYILDDATERAAEAIQKHNPLLAPLLEHPEFAQSFKEALATTPPQQWRNPMFLAQVAGAIAPQLAQGWTPPQRRDRPRDEEGRFVNQQQRGSYDRQNLGQFGASGQQPGRGGQAQYTDIDRIMAEREGISLEEAATLNDPTYESTRRVQAKVRGRR